jgi:hypothetical protein
MKKVSDMIDAMMSKRGSGKGMPSVEVEIEGAEKKESGDMEECNIAAEEILSAVNAGDPVALAEALKAFMELC